VNQRLHQRFVTNATFGRIGVKGVVAVRRAHAVRSAWNVRLLAIAINKGSELSSASSGFVARSAGACVVYRYTRAAAVLTKASSTVKKRRTCFLLLLTSVKSTSTGGVVYFNFEATFWFSFHIYFDGVSS